MTLSVIISPACRAAYELRGLLQQEEQRMSSEVSSRTTDFTPDAYASILRQALMVQQAAQQTATAVKQTVSIAENALVLVVQEAQQRSTNLLRESAERVATWELMHRERVEQVLAPALLQLEKAQRLVILQEAAVFLQWAGSNEPEWREQAEMRATQRRIAELENIAEQLARLQTDCVDAKLVMYDIQKEEREKLVKDEVNGRSIAFIREIQRKEEAQRRPPPLAQQAKAFQRPPSQPAPSVPSTTSSSGSHPTPSSSSYLYGQSAASRPTQPPAQQQQPYNYGGASTSSRPQTAATFGYANAPTQLGYPAPQHPGYPPAQPAGGYSYPTSGYPAAQPGYPGQPGYPAAQPGYPGQPGGGGYHLYQHPSAQQYRPPSAFR